MALLTEGGKSLLKEALFRLNLEDNEWSLPEAIGTIIGSRMSLLGCTNNPQSLAEVWVAVQRIVSEINEVRTFRTESAVQVSKGLIQHRYGIFFQGFDVKEYGDIAYRSNTLDDIISALSRKNTRETVSEVFNVILKVVEGSGITTMIHNQKKEEAAAPETQPTQTE